MTASRRCAAAARRCDHRHEGDGRTVNSEVGDAVNGRPITLTLRGAHVWSPDAVRELLVVTGVVEVMEGASRVGLGGLGVVEAERNAWE